MLTIKNIDKIHYCFDGGPYYVTYTTEWDSGYGFVMDKVGNDRKGCTIVLDRRHKRDDRNDYRPVYMLEVEGVTTKWSITFDWLSSKENLLRALNEICKHCLDG